MQVTLKDMTGQAVESIEISDGLFSVPMNSAVVHQALVREQAGKRKGTAATKTRKDVSGGGRKPWIQKHTGRARAGTSRSPLWRKGGVTFGPHPRTYAQRMPRKMRRLALYCLLSAKAMDQRLVVVQDLKLERPRTKDMLQLLSNLDIPTSALLVTEERDPVLVKSASNLERVKALGTLHLTGVDLTKYDTLVMTVAAVRRAEEVWTRETQRTRKARVSQV